MKRELTFAEALKYAPPIHAFRLNPFESAETTMLKPQKQDCEYSAMPYSYGFMSGDGSAGAPYEYESAAPVSAHYAVVDLWFRFRKSQQPIFIKANDWLLRVDREGVSAEDGHFTRLLPKKRKKNKS